MARDRSYSRSIVSVFFISLLAADAVANPFWFLIRPSAGRMASQSASRVISRELAEQSARGFAHPSTASFLRYQRLSSQQWRQVVSAFALPDDASDAHFANLWYQHTAAADSSSQQWRQVVSTFALPDDASDARFANLWYQHAAAPDGSSELSRTTSALVAHSAPPYGEMSHLFPQVVLNEKSSSLVHLTNVQGQIGILSSNSLRGKNGLFAVPAATLSENEIMRALRTGLPTARTTQHVLIPPSAYDLFRRPVPMGPYSTWKRLGGVHFAPPGELDLLTGELHRSTTIARPRVLIYGPDGIFYVGLVTAGGLCLYAVSTSEDESEENTSGTSSDRAALPRRSVLPARTGPPSNKAMHAEHGLRVFSSGQSSPRAR